MKISIVFTCITYFLCLNYKWLTAPTRSTNLVMKIRDRSRGYSVLHSRRIFYNPWSKPEDMGFSSFLLHCFITTADRSKRSLYWLRTRTPYLETMSSIRALIQAHWHYVRIVYDYLHFSIPRELSSAREVSLMQNIREITCEPRKINAL